MTISTNISSEIHVDCNKSTSFGSVGQGIVSTLEQISCIDSKPSDVLEPVVTDCPDSSILNDVDSKLGHVDVNIDRVRAVTLRVPVVVNGQEVKAVVDTGAEVTVLSESLYLRIPEEIRPPLYQAKRNLVVAEAGQRMRTSGVADVLVQIGSEQFEWSIYVAPIGDEILLGCDIIDDKDITINTRRGLEVKGQWINCDVIRKEDKVARVILKETVTIPANSEVILPGRSVNSECLDTRFCSIEPVVQDERNLLVARCLVDPYQDTVPVRIVNLEKFPVKFKKNYLFGELHPVVQFEKIADEEFSYPFSNMANRDVKLGYCEKGDMPVIPDDWNCFKVSSEESGSEGSKAEIPKLPDHLTELYEKSSEKLFNHEHKLKLAEVLLKNSDAFAKNKLDLGSCSVISHKIETAGAPPIRQPLRRTPQGFEGEEEKYLQEQLENGVVVPSKSSWASPVCLVRKKDGSVRWCIDFRRLNMVTLKDAYPLPKISMCLDCLSTASVFSVMDLQSGYWQLDLAPEDRPKTAFITKYGLFEYTKMPFGLCNAPSTFQRCMELIFRGMQWKTLLIYLDDIILFSSTLDDHFEKLDEVLSRLKNADLKLKPSKCEFIKEEVTYLGHVVSKEGIKPNPKIIEAVKNWKIPQSVKEVQQFLGLCNYYRQYVLKFSEIASPLSRLTRKDVPFLWTEECNISFNTLKKALCEAPILAYPASQGQFILDTDASNVGIGAVLSQIQDDKEKVIAYGSKKLDKQQQRYSVTRRELLAVITFIHQFRHYLLGRKFLLRTDHGSLRWLFSFKDPQGQLARWLEALSQYDFEILHRPGLKHQNADSLSRKDGEKVLCCHQQEGKFNVECQSCKSMSEEWSNFKSDIDDVGNLVKGSVADHIRVVTRSQTRDQVQSNWLLGYTNQEIETFQKEDKDLKPVHEWVENDILPSRDDAAAFSPSTRKYWLNSNLIEKRNGVLYQKRITNNVSDVSYQLLVPKILRKEVIKTCHDAPYAGHFGISKTLDKLKSLFHWYKMGEDVKLHVKNCTVCNRFKSLNKRPRAALQKYVVGSPMDRIGIDVIGPLPKSMRGNKYILVIGDHFTRWMEAYPIPNQQAEVVAEKMVHEFFARFGTPLEIHSDQGRNFESDLFSEICKLFEVKKTRSTPYRPCSNGIIEKFNGTLEKMIRSFVNKNANNWDLYIGILMAAYRSTPHPATGYSPNMLMLGREVILPNQLIFPIPRDGLPQQTADTYFSELREKIEDVYHIARQNLGNAAIHQKRDYDTRLSQCQFSVGSLVYRYNNFFKKFEERWSGPFVVTKVLSPVVYKIQGRRKSENVHHDRLKLYQSDDVPAWAKDVLRKMQK